jgi:hypothetical protein
MRPGAFYRLVLGALQSARLPFLIGGAFAQGCYTGTRRATKDLDLMIGRPDWPDLARVMRARGLRTRLTFPHWLGKVRGDDHLVDVLFNSGNGLTPVDDSWFARAVPAQVLGYQVDLVPPEELIWSKAFVMERERFDGADVLHLMRALVDHLDWAHLCDRFEGHTRVLFAHVILFGYVYPGLAGRLPAWLIPRLLESADRESGVDPDLCRGTLLSRAQYLQDVRLDLADARRPPHGGMTDREFAIWTNGIARDGPSEVLPATAAHEAARTRVARATAARPR